MAFLVSIILPNFNHAPFLQERLNSIFNQTYQNFEVLILDDASTDKSLQLLELYRNHPKVAHFIVNVENTGSPFKQWKRGLELAKGDYVWIAESDDSCELDFLEKQLPYLKESDLVVARTLTFNREGIKKEIQHPAFAQENKTTLTKNSLLYCPVLNVSAAVCKKIDTTTLENAIFVTYPIIGDRVFYYEYFQGKQLAYNDTTVNYFRREGTGLSNLETKGLSYLAAYFREHVRFITTVVAVDQRDVPKTLVVGYIKRFFYRVRDRLSRKEKLSFQYLKLYLYYRFKLMKVS